MSTSLVGRDRTPSKLSSSNGDGIEPEPPVSKKLVKCFDGFYRSHGISISDTNLFTMVILGPALARSP